MKLNDSIRYLKGIGEKRAELFHKLGIFAIEDLLYHLPRGYEDRSDIRSVADVVEGESVCVSVSLASGIKSFRARTGARVIKAYMSDGTGVIDVTWFNSPYIANTLKDAGEFILFGKIGFNGRCAQMVNPVMERVENAGGKTGKIIPIYACTAGLSQRNIREAVLNALSGLDEPIRETLPKNIREMYDLEEINQAINQVHQPDDFDKFERARKRLVFEEFIVLQLGIGMSKERKRIGKASAFSDVKCIAEFANSLPFELTNAQKRVINEICMDLKQETPMNRLVQGDVGSGKTVVAAAVMYAAVKSGYQGVMMAPTEILAKQHFKTLTKLFENMDIEIAFLSGSLKATEKREAKESIASGKAQIIVGTHALISEGVEFLNLGITITDEQHRFGVKQRAVLGGKDKKIHSLHMTATPIPRTLSLILYGDLDISIIDELPKGRKKITTLAVTEGKRKRVEDFVLKELDQGRQAYFVCPLIEESEVIDANAVEEYISALKKGAYRGRKIEALHGKLKAAEKEDIMKRFMAGEIEALVSTTVIEVGVDVPNATIMVIENAERFGLSQLHQLRGRVGRGKHQSYCIMFYNGGGFVEERMKVMCETDNGFKIAEKDLELRGPGEFLGTRQHGLPEMRIGNLMTDMNLLKEAQGAATYILGENSGLSGEDFSILRNKVERAFKDAEGTLN